MKTTRATRAVKPAKKASTTAPRSARAETSAKGGPKVGSPAPSFSLPADSGEEVTLAGQKGKWVILYFYPRDNTPGCTIEGSDFRDLSPSFRRLRTRILGISTDTLESHGRFRDKMKFPFELGSDEDHAVASLFGAWRQKNMYGRKNDGNRAQYFSHRRQGRPAPGMAQGPRGGPRGGGPRRGPRALIPAC